MLPQLVCFSPSDTTEVCFATAVLGSRACIGCLVEMLQLNCPWVDRKYAKIASVPVYREEIEAESCCLSQICLYSALPCPGRAVFFPPNPAALALAAQWDTVPISTAEAAGAGAGIARRQAERQHRGSISAAPILWKCHPARHQVLWIPLAAPCDPCMPRGLTGRSGGHGAAGRKRGS